jgi:hypothetical protein
MLWDQMKVSFVVREKNESIPVGCFLQFGGSWQLDLKSVMAMKDETLFLSPFS